MNAIMQILWPTFFDDIGKDEEDDDFELDDAEPFVPTTFGTRDATFGAKMGKADFGTKYLSQLLKSKGSPDALGSCLVKDDKTKAFVQKYAGSETAFLKDVPEAYLRMTLLGETGTNRNSWKCCWPHFYFLEIASILVLYLSLFFIMYHIQQANYIFQPLSINVQRETFHYCYHLLFSGKLEGWETKNKESFL